MREDEFAEHLITEMFGKLLKGKENGEEQQREDKGASETSLYEAFSLSESSNTQTISPKLYQSALSSPLKKSLDLNLELSRKFTKSGKLRNFIKKIFKI